MSNVPAGKQAELIAELISTLDEQRKIEIEEELYFYRMVDSEEVSIAAFGIAHDILMKNIAYSTSRLVVISGVSEEKVESES